MTHRKDSFTVGRIALVATLLLGTAGQAADLYTDMAPPPPRNEQMPHPREGMIWAPGHWEWSGKAYYWQEGSWLPERHKQQWVSAHWESTGNQWHFLPGHWQRLE